MNKYAEEGLRFLNMGNGYLDEYGCALSLMFDALYAGSENQPVAKDSTVTLLSR